MGRHKEEKIDLDFVDTFGEDDLELWNEFKDAYEDEIKKIYDPVIRGDRAGG